MKKTGIVGGTFDPVHKGHLMLGRQAFEEYELDKVWYMPSRQPPHKKDHFVTSSEERMEMVHLAISETPYFHLSDFEVKRTEGNTYTADTLRLLKKHYPDTIFYFIVGADSVFDIEKWYHPEEVLHLAVLLTASREGSGHRRTLDEQIHYLCKKYGAQIGKLHSVEMNIASEEIRRMVLEGKSISDFVPARVEEYIRNHRLYELNDEYKNKNGRRTAGH